MDWIRSTLPTLPTLAHVPGVTPGPKARYTTTDFANQHRDSNLRLLIYSRWSNARPRINRRTTHDHNRPYQASETAPSQGITHLGKGRVFG